MSYMLLTNELYHHGVKGQKWGVRRYQNYDGSYTQAGYKRYQQSLDNYNKALSDRQTLIKASKSGKKVSGQELARAKDNVVIAKAAVSKAKMQTRIGKVVDKGHSQRLRGNGLIKNNLRGFAKTAGASGLTAVGLKMTGSDNESVSAAGAILTGVGMAYGIKSSIVTTKNNIEIGASYINDIKESIKKK